MNALRMTMRQLGDDLAKMAQSCAVVPLLTTALLFANAMALEESIKYRTGMLAPGAHGHKGLTSPGRP
jgi:hypothetical protein